MFAVKIGLLTNRREIITVPNRRFFQCLSIMNLIVEMGYACVSLQILNFQLTSLL